MKVHKFFQRGARAALTKQPWPLPPSAAAVEPEWLQAADGPLVPCRNGLHACRVEQLSYWIADELWEVEIGEEWIETRHSIVARRARLVRRIEAWEGEGSAAQELTNACWQRAQAAAARATEVSTRARQYLEAAEQFARAGRPALAAYVSALVSAALGPSEQQLARFDAERREQSLLLAAAAGL